MFRFAHILLVACLSLASALAPLLAGKVVCTTDDGHRAIEVAHDDNGCAVVASMDDARADGSETPCNDEPVGDIETAVQGGKANDQGINLALAFDWSVFSYLSAVDQTLPRIPFACSSDLLPNALSQGGLSTIVLLI